MGFVGIPNSPLFSGGHFHLGPISQNTKAKTEVNYTDQKKLLPNVLKFKLNKRGVSFLRECSNEFCGT